MRTSCFLILLLLLACPNDVPNVETSESGMPAGSTSDDAPGGSASSITTSGDAQTVTTSTPDTGGAGTESSLSSEGSSDLGDNTTGEHVDPLPDPPSGCAKFIEWVGRHAQDFRHVTVDTATCPRGSRIKITFSAVAPDPSFFEFELPPEAMPCQLIGGPLGPAIGEPGAIILPIEGPENLIAWEAAVLVDDVVSDDVRVPDVLIGQHWMLEPFAPAFPIRRREDWSWVPRMNEGHQPGCELATVF